MSPRLKAAPRRRRLSRPVAGGAQAALTQAMVDRLMWRAGFGPDEAGRAALKGLTLHTAVDRLIAAPQTPKGPAAVRSDGTPLKPYASDTDLVLSWCDQMIRTGNPLVERLTFFWHRHFATQRTEVSPPAAHDHAERALPPLRGPAGLPHRQLPHPRLRDGRGAGDAALPHRRGQHQEERERELRPRADGAVLRSA